MLLLTQYVIQEIESWRYIQLSRLGSVILFTFSPQIQGYYFVIGNNRIFSNPYLFTIQDHLLTSFDGTQSS